MNESRFLPGSAVLPGSAPVPPPAVLPPSMRRPAPDTRLSATSLIDESVHRLRRSLPGTLAIYYAGTLPFILALLYFWADQGHSPDADTHGAVAALGLALLFVWMKTGQSVFAARLAASIRRQGGAPWTGARLARLAFVQTALQPSGLFALVVAAILTIPFGWVYAFYQNITVLGDGETSSVRAVFSRATHHALLQPKQNHSGLAVLTLLGFFVWLNLLVLAGLLPQLARMFTGEENVFTRSGTHYLLNTTFFAVTGALVYLVLDPLAKTFYLLRCFYADSQRTGEDLQSELAALPPPAVGAAALVLVIAGLCLLGQPARAAVAAPPPVTVNTAVSPVAAPAPPSVAPGTVSAPELGRSIEDVFRRREFAWRTPRQTSPEKSAGPLDSFFDGIGRWWDRCTDTVGGWISRTWKKLAGQQRPHDDSKANEGGSFSISPETLRGIIYTLVAALVAMLGWLTWRQFRGSRSGVAEGSPAPAVTGPTPDLTDDSVLATQLPEDEWLQLAGSLIASGHRRLALRAFYLSVLAGLGERGLLAIARHKSNRDYLLELRRRARDRAEVQSAFARNVSRFERVWYGQHEADDLLLADFQADRQLVLG